MKSFNMFVMVLAFALNAGAADVLTEKLQRGLFEEEANHNLDAAIKEYQSVVAQSDEPRKVTATALFRLGECYRKLGRTNEANAQYQRILRDFSEQEQLVKLSRELTRSSVNSESTGAGGMGESPFGARLQAALLRASTGATGELSFGARLKAILLEEGGGVTGDSELVRELERRQARLQVELSEASARLDTVNKMTREQLRQSASQLFNDSQVATLQEQLRAAEQKLRSLHTTLSDKHPDVQAARALVMSIFKQFDDRLDSLLVGQKAQLDVLAAQHKAVETSLQRARTAGASGPPGNTQGWKTVTDPEQARLLQEEIRLAEQVVQAAEHKLSVGKSSLFEVLQAKKDVLPLKRMLPENATPAQQRALIGEQTEIVRQLLTDFEKRIQVGALAPRDELPIKRELLSLQRELAMVSDVAASSAEPSSASSMTQAEAEALARAKTLARNSPDLLQSPTRDGLGELQLGARDGFYSVVEFILAQGVSANGPERGMPPLVLAAKGGHLRIVQLLLDKGADVNAMGGGNTALMNACENGYRAVVELLLQRGADVNRVGSSTALHKVAAKGYSDLTKLLLQRGANPDLVGGSARETPLHLAVGSGLGDVAESLLNAGASTTITNAAGVTALHTAASRGDTNIAARLLNKGADPNAEDLEGKTPLYNSLKSPRPPAMVRFLLARNADVNRRHVIEEGGRPMSHYPLIDAIAAGQQEVIDAMLEAKADLKVINQGLTPLLVAMNVGRVAVIERLLRAGADPNFTLPNAYPPLFKAVTATASPEIVAALLKHGADPNFVNQQGFTPLFGVRRPEILQLLLDHKADPNKGHNPVTELLRTGDYLTPTRLGIGVPVGTAGQLDVYPAIELLLKGGANPNATFTDGKRLLTFAVNNRDIKLLSLLLKHGAEVNYVVNNETPLSLVQHATRDPRITSKEWEQIEKALREHGANEYLQRLSTISYTRPTWTGSAGSVVFSRGTNEYNRYMLFEMLAAVFTGMNQPAFPDLSRVTIERLEGANPKRKELAINIEELLRAGDCSNNMWLEWGDRISLPETDHPLNEGWGGLPQETIDLLTKCLTRRVSIIVKQETNMVKLMHNWSPDPVYGGIPGVRTPQPAFGGLPPRPARQLGGEAPAKEKPEKVLHTFRLKEVVYGANVLRASSDPTRVRVTRTEGDKTKEWMFDLPKIPSANNASPTPIHDLWLRDGDVIEIPEKP